jgi:hypothetical protein
MAPNLSLPTRALDSTLRTIMDGICSLNLSKTDYTPPEKLRAAKERCGDAPSRRASVPSPYQDSYSYCGVQANAMYRRGGNSIWADEVRGCLTCMDELEIAPHDAHMFCYEEGTKKSGTFWGTIRGYAEAIDEGSKNLTGSFLRKIGGAVSEGTSSLYGWLKERF